MLVILYILIANSALAQHTFVNLHRFNFGGILVGIWEISLLLGLVVAALIGGQYDARNNKTQTHKAMLWLMLFEGLGMLFGFTGAIINNAGVKNALASCREYAAWPICIYIGYRLLPSLRAAKAVVWTLILCGLITATLLLRHFGENAEIAGIRNSWNYVRTVNWVTTYAGLACMIVVYSLVNTRLKFMPVLLALAIAAYCLLGQWAPLNRGDWVQMMGAFAVLPLFMPAGKRLAMAMRTLLLLPILIAALWGGVNLASALTQRDFGKKISDRLYTLLPTQRYSKDEKAWDSRLPGITLELSIWAKNPIMGEGFAAQEVATERTGVLNFSTNHNGWSSVLAKTGIFGFIASVMTWVCMIVIGRKLLFESSDRYVTLLGFACAIGGVILFINVLATMIWTSRGAMIYGIILGAAFKCRDLMLSPAPVSAYDDAYPPLDRSYEPMAISY